MIDSRGTYECDLCGRVCPFSLKELYAGGTTWFVFISAKAIAGTPPHTLLCRSCHHNNGLELLWRKIMTKIKANREAEEKLCSKCEIPMECELHRREDNKVVSYLSCPQCLRIGAKKIVEEHHQESADLARWLMLGTGDDSGAGCAAGHISEVDITKIKEFVAYIESKKIEEKITCIALEAGDIIFVPKSRSRQVQSPGFGEPSVHIPDGPREYREEGFGGYVLTADGWRPSNVVERDIETNPGKKCSER